MRFTPGGGWRSDSQVAKIRGEGFGSGGGEERGGHDCTLDGLETYQTLHLLLVERTHGRRFCSHCVTLRCRGFPT